jgi:hypothetical protein
MNSFINIDIELQDEDAQKDEAMYLALVTIMHDRLLLTSAADILDAYGFFDASPVYKFIWDILFEYYAEYGELPSEIFIRKEIDLRYPSFETRNLNAVPKETLLEIIEEGYRAKESAVDRQVIRGLIKDHLSEKARALLEDSEDLAEGIRRASHTLSQDPLQKVQEVQILAPLDKQAEQFENDVKLPLYVDVVDQLLDGGMHVGNSLLIVAPTGGGKTTIAWQMLHGHALAGRHCMLLTFEQKFDNDLRLRACVLASGSTREAWDRIRDPNDPMTVDHLPHDEVQRYHAVAPKIVEYGHVLDIWATEHSRVRSVTDLYQQAFNGLADQEIAPLIDTVVIDWWGPLRNRLEESNPRMADATYMRHYMEDCKKAFKICSQEFGVRTVLLHQLSGATQKKSHNAVVQSSEGMEDAALNQMFDYAMAMSKRNPTDDTFTIYLDKARGTKMGSIKAQMVGERCYIKKADSFGGTGSMVQEIQSTDAGVLFTP